MELESTLIFDMEEFVALLKEQLRRDLESRGEGNSEIEKFRLGQEYRFIEMTDYHFSRWNLDGTTPPWVEIAKDCFIAWVKENHPELFPK